ncbi:hypothetical protein GCM10023238_02610 [Streptomyces heliomycini]
MKMQAEIISGMGRHRPRGLGRSLVTVLGHPLTAEATAAITSRITRAAATSTVSSGLAKYR